jgi:hypothetical protein
MSLNRDAEHKYISAIPNPEYLIKSIAEQGYTLESAIADLADNSITADCTNIEILLDSDTEPFQLFICDDGNGMSLEELKNNCKFPSSSPEHARSGIDLGRFGLGMKAASFSQTRKFTVLSRPKGTERFNALTWDVEFIKKTGEWRLIVNSQNEIDTLLADYGRLSRTFINPLTNFEANTIIVWSGLYKFEDYLNEKNRSKALNREISINVSEHLGIVFHRFMEKKSDALKIRVNNYLIPSFNPFPEKQKALRSIEYKQKQFGTDNIKLEGFVLPSIALDEVKSEQNSWTTSNKSLIDMEGVYVYRANRLILYGGWNGLIKKFPRLQLARLRVDIGNSADHLLHLNVAKSAVIIPHDLKEAFEGYIRELTTEATKEYYNRGLRKFPERKQKSDLSLFNKVHTNKGPLLEINESYPLIEMLQESLNQEQNTRLNLLLRVFNNSVNTIRNIHEGAVHYEIDTTLESDSLMEFVLKAKEYEFSSSFIIDHISKNFGISKSNLPNHILKLLEQ